MNERGIIMNRTAEYWKIAQAHREALRAIWATYTDTMAKLDRYKGSAGYADDESAAAKARDEAIKAQKAVTGKAFDDLLSSMREKVGGQAAIPPGDAEVRLLQTLKLRNKISREELQAAGRALQDNSVALHALDDIAQAQGFNNLFIQYPAWRDNGNDQQMRIASLFESAKRIVGLDRPDSKRDALSAAARDNNINALRSVMVDRDFENEDDAIELFGGFRDRADLEAFRKAVND